LQPLLITSGRLIDGRQQLLRQVLMEKFFPMDTREARLNKNATMQNKWLFQVSEVFVSSSYHFEELIEKLADLEPRVFRAFRGNEINVSNSNLNHYIFFYPLTFFDY